MLTVSILPNGNTVYSLKTFTGKYEDIVKKFFNRAYAPYHKILVDACGDKITDMNAAEKVYYGLVAHANKIFSPFMFLWNYHNFVAFLQQFKPELENMGIKTFFPVRQRSAAKVFSIEFDPDGVQVEEKPKKMRTHYEDTNARITTMDSDKRSKYFNKWIVTNKKRLTDDTYVVRTKDGSAPVIFFNIKKGDINVPSELTSTKDIKAYEVDRLKCIYAEITGINYMLARPITFKNWKNLSDAKKIGTNVASISPEIQKSIAFAL